MAWADFGFGIWIGVLLTCVLELVALAVWVVFSDLFARLKKLEDVTKGGEEAT